jgi:hypothetical protein
LEAFFAYVCRYIKTIPENHFSSDLNLAQFNLLFIWPKDMLFGQNYMSFEEKKRKS